MTREPRKYLGKIEMNILQQFLKKVDTALRLGQLIQATIAEQAHPSAAN
jgi:hypothetical protein